MVAAGPLRSNKREPIPIDARAVDHLKYIRETMESAAEFTAVPGWGGVAMGITALAAAFVAARQSSPRAWLAVWLVEAFVAVAIAAPTAVTKAHRANSALFSGPGRKFLFSFAPPIIVGGLLTFALYAAGAAAAAARRLAASLWDCYRHGWSVFRARRSGHGILPDESRRGGAFRARCLGRCIYGGGIRRFANRFRHLDRAASRWIKGNRMAKSSSAHQERHAAHARA